MQRIAPLILATAVSISIATSALAHHSHPRFYDACKTLTIEGRIASVEWKNPHIHVVVTMADGTTYTAELTSPANLARQGVADAAMSALTAGAYITFTGNPLRDPAEIRASFPEIPAISDTKIVDVYSISRRDGSWSWSRTIPECSLF